MVPMKLARTAPTTRKVRFTRGVATRLPVRWMPPDTVNRASNRTMKETYSVAVSVAASKPREPNWMKRYMSVGTPSTAEKMALLRLLSNQCSAARGRMAMPSSMRTKGASVQMLSW